MADFFLHQWLWPFGVFKMIKKIRIWDFDGVLVDSSSRYRLLPCGDKIDLPHWRKHEKTAYFDSVNKDNLAVYQNQLNDHECYVIIATARLCFSADYAFIDNKIGRPNKLICRENANDNRGGAELKIEGIKRLLNLKQFKSANDIIVYEDNIKYLKKLCDTFKCQGVYIPSNQGH